MAQVFSSVGSPDFPLLQKSLIVEETPVEPDDLFEKANFESVCKNEHVLNGYKLQSYYQFQARTIENLLKHHEETERKLKISETARDDLEKKLTRTEKERDDAKGKLAEALVELKETKDKLAMTEEELKIALDDLESKDRELAILRTKLQKAQKDLEPKDEELGRLRAQLFGAQEDLKNEKDINKKNRKLIEERELKLTEAHKKRDTLLKELSELAPKKDAAEKEIQKLQKEKQDLQDSIKNFAFLRHPKNIRDDIYIDEVTYGGEVLKDQSVLKQLLEYAAENKEFKITNKLWGRDPWTGVEKSFSAVYAVGNKGPFKYINKREGEFAKFVR